MHRVWSACFLALAVLIVAAGAYASLTSGGPRMGRPTTIKRPAFHGYYDGHKDTYLNTDVSNKAEAKAMHVNYAPVLKSVPLKTAPEIYLVQGKVDAARAVAREDRVAHVPAPHRQALALALLEVASAYDGPPCVAGEHAPARLHLVVEVGEAGETRERAEDLDDRPDLPRVDVL